MNVETNRFKYQLYGNKTGMRIISISGWWGGLRVCTQVEAKPSIEHMVNAQSEKTAFTAVAIVMTVT